MQPLAIVRGARLVRMKEDVLEQIVDDYLQMQGYFTTHNVRFNPPKDEYYVTRDDSVPFGHRCRRFASSAYWSRPGDDRLV